MRVDLPHVVYPAPGLPAVLEDGEDGFEMVVAHRDLTTPDVRAWAQNLSLECVLKGRIVPLDVESVEALVGGAMVDRVREFAGVPEAASLDLARVRLRATDPLAPPRPRRVSLFHLLRDGRSVKRRAVGVLAGTSGHLRLAFASDLHVAASWEEILAALRRQPGVHGEHLVDPRRCLEIFIGEVNALAAKGELDVVVLGGDLVDHVHTAAGASGTNVDLLLDLLDELQVPTVAIPGNHDYRLQPWRPRTYGLAPIGVPSRSKRGRLRAAGLWSRGLLTREDFFAVRTENAGGRPAITEHLLHIAPSTDFALTIRGTRLVFASTGRDIVGRWREVEPSRRALLLRTLASAWHHPVSEGLTDVQLRRIRRALDDATGAAVFLHAPVVHRSDGRAVDLHVRDRDLAEDAPLHRRIAFERRLQRSGLRKGVLFRNPGQLLGALVSCTCPVTVFSGHVHRSTALALDRHSRTLRTSTLEPPGDPDRTALLTTAPALGQVGPRAEDRPGYLLADFEKGRLCSVAVRR